MTALTDLSNLKMSRVDKTITAIGKYTFIRT